MARESLKIDFEKETQIYERESSPYIRALLIGEPGSGKTHMAGTFPNCYFLDVDKGMATLSGQRLPFYSIDYGREASRITMMLLARLNRREAPFEKTQTFVLDSLSALSNLMEVELAKYPTESSKSESKEVMSLPDFRVHRRRMLNIVTSLMRLSEKMNVIVTANIEYDKDEVFGSIIEVPSVAGKKVPLELGRYFDEIYRLGYDPSEKVWILNSKPTKFFRMAKTRRQVPDNLVDPSYEALKPYIEGDKE
jgi:hypothetical protein